MEKFDWYGILLFAFGLFVSIWDSIYTKSCKEGQINHNYSYGRNAWPMPDKYQGGGTDPRIEVATREVKWKNDILFELFTSKAFQWGVYCPYQRHFFILAKNYRTQKIRGFIKREVDTPRINFYEIKLWYFVIWNSLAHFYQLTQYPQ